MRRMCFDSGGLLYEQAQLQYNSGSTLSDDAFAAYAACNLGYIGCASHSAHVRLWVRPSHVSDDALTGAIYYLAQEHPSRVVLHTFENSWTTAIVPRGHAIDLLCQFSRLGEAQVDYRRREITVLPQRFRALLELWKSLSGSYRPEQYLNLASELLDDRLFVIERQPEHLRYQHFGGSIGRRTFVKEVAQGATVECFSDASYALNTEISYNEAFEKPNKPSLEQISTRVRSEHLPEAYIEYVRMLLPCRNSSGDPLLVGTSIMQSMVH